MGLKIGILLGDDIGHEVVPECVKVMKAAAARAGLADRLVDTLPIGKHGHEQHGNTLPAVTEAALRNLDGWIMGPIGHAAYPRNDPTWVMPAVRKKFELFAAVRPSRSYPNINSIHKDVDIVFVRELTEGMLYSETVVAGAPEFRPNDDITVAMRVITRKGSNRVAREAFEIARTRPRKKVTAAHKEPVYRLACGMFAEECRKVAREYPDVTFEEAMIDTISMKLVMAPQQYDVVVTTNQFGDILTDIGAGLVGGLGLAPGLCVGEKQAMAQATHGSAPDIAGPQHRQSLRHDRVGADADGLPRPQAQRTEGDRSRRLHAGGDRQGHHARQASDQGPGRQSQHPGHGKCHRGSGAAISRRKTETGSVMYNLHLSAEQLEIRDTVRDFVTREIKPVALKADRLDVQDRSLLTAQLDAASQLGLRTLALSEALGGAGADALTSLHRDRGTGGGRCRHRRRCLSETSRLAHLLFDRAMNDAQRDQVPAEISRRRPLSSRFRRLRRPIRGWA